MTVRGSLRLAGFVALYGVMYVLLSSFWSEGLSHFVIDFATVKPAAWLARSIAADPDILAVGSHIQSPGASVNVLYGCEGTDVFMLLTAALLVAPVSWRNRALGVLAGFLFVFALNQARVLALYFAFRSRRDWFGPIHGFIGPMLVVLAVTMFFFTWLRWAQSNGKDSQAA